jgi:adenosylcobyric acid synthase
MRIALASNSPVILVGDIDKGGVLASIVGTLALLNKNERKLVKGIIINKFRGDLRLFKDGVRFLEKRTGIKVLGVIPYFRDIEIPEEDAVPWEKRAVSGKTKRPLNISVICLPHLSNFTDFDVLEQEPDVNLTYVRKASEFGNPDSVILPGTKNTISDMSWLKTSGIVPKILAYASKRKSTVIGICGGYQMLGTEIHDKEHIESKKSIEAGLSLLPIRTELKKQKHLRQVAGFDIKSGTSVKGYEIHHGETTLGKGCKPAFKITGSENRDGAVSADGRIWGTYLHGIFDSDKFRRHFLNKLRKIKGLKPVSVIKYDHDKEFDKLADHVRNNIDIKAVYKILNVTKTTGTPRTFGLSESYQVK